MDEKAGNILVGIFVFFIIAAFIMPSCDRGDRYNVNVQQTMVYASEGLDLQAVGSLVKNAKNSEELERLINDQSSGINNLDLNEDGTVDYINVKEYGNANTRGFSLTTKIDNEVQEIATIEIEKLGNDQGSMEIHGHSSIYGHNHYYRSHFTLGDYLVLRYMWGPGWGVYRSPYYYGYYPPYYRSYRTVSRTSYRTRTSKYTTGSKLKKSSSSGIKSKIKSPNASRTASKIKAPLRNPTTSQKSFQKRNPSKQVRSGGFGRSSSSSRSSSYSRSSSVRRSSSSRSGGFFGGK